MNLKMLDNLTVKVLMLGLVAPALFAALCPAQDIFLTHGKLVDPRTRTVREGNLLIKNGVIAGSPARAPEGFDGQVLDLGGRWIIPGLYDLHTHSVLNMAPGGVREMLGTEIVARRLLYAGVTGFLDLFNDERYVFGLRDHQRGAKQRSNGVADIYAAGACLTATDGHGTEYPIPARIIDTPADARREVADLARHHPDVVKIIYDHMPEGSHVATWRTVQPSIDEPTLRAAVAAAKKHGIATVIHIHSWQDVRDAVEAGADAITHLPDEPIPADLPRLMAAAGTTVIPTLAVGDTSFMEHPEVLDTPLLRALTNDAVVAAYREFGPSEAGQRTLNGLRPAQARRFQTLRQLSEAGVPLATGTDAGNWFTIQGYSMHRELAMMVDAGLSPWDALAAATTTAGAFLGRPVGLATGDLGSVVVLDASPLEDIRNTERISRVIHHGVVRNRAALRAQPDDAWRPPMPQAAP